MTLYELVNITYDNMIQLGEGEKITFDDLISDYDNCIAFIDNHLEFKGSNIISNKHRASHIIVTWLLGIGIGQNMNIYDFNGEFGHQFKSKLWLQTAMIHDYGFFCRELSEKNLSIVDGM